MGKLLATIVMAGFVPVGYALAWAAPPSPQDGLDPATLAARIDQRLEEKWKSTVPAPASTDAEFLRRVYLDLTGRIPRVTEVRDFLEDGGADRRSRIIEELLESPRYVSHFSTTWLNLLLPSTDDPRFASQADTFKLWLQEQVRRNTPYNKMVREILTAALPKNGKSPRGGLIRPEPSPLAFLIANEQKPENLAASTSRIFMGVKLECAQCHDHPFARWTRGQFWEMSAFFVADVPPAEPPVPGQQAAEPPASVPGEITIPGTDKVVRAKFLSGDEPDWTRGEPRAVLADWLISRDNPYFARTAVNRIWAHFFGVGLVDPIDDEPTEDNPASYPELLDELSREFVAHEYDIKYLIRAITLSRAYQRTSAQSHPSHDDPRAFARMPIRGLSPMQVFDSIALATGFKESPQRLVGNDSPISARADFLNRFAGQERTTEKQTSILQALALMNGRFVADATSLERSVTLAAVADAPFLGLEQKIETLYLATLGRPPTPEELQRLVAYVSAGGPRGQARLALGDIFWALLNSSEFILNH